MWNYKILEKKKSCEFMKLANEKKIWYLHDWEITKSENYLIWNCDYKDLEEQNILDENLTYSCAHVININWFWRVNLISQEQKTYGKKIRKLWKSSYNHQTKPLHIQVCPDLVWLSN